MSDGSPPHRAVLSNGVSRVVVIESEVVIGKKQVDLNASHRRAH